MKQLIKFEFSKLLKKKLVFIALGAFALIYATMLWSWIFGNEWAVTQEGEMIYGTEAERYNTEIANQMCIRDRSSTAAPASMKNVRPVRLVYTAPAMSAATSSAASAEPRLPAGLQGKMPPSTSKAWTALQTLPVLPRSWRLRAFTVR